MCGPLAAACGQSRGATRTYHLARLATYGSLGAVASMVVRPIREMLPSGASVWGLGIVMAVALLVSARRVLRPRAAREPLVSVKAMVRKPGGMPALAPVGLGMITGLLPCGSLYGALAVAATATHTRDAVLSMLVFGGVSAAGLALSNMATRMLVADASGTGRRLVASVMVLGAVLALTRPLVRPNGDPSCHPAGAVATEPHEIENP
jgi:sulfite exporter TauE/SafE